MHNLTAQPKTVWITYDVDYIADAPAKKLGIEIKQTYLTNGPSDLLSIVESASGDNVAKFCMAIGQLGNVRTSTVRGWPEADYAKFISELP